MNTILGSFKLPAGSQFSQYLNHNLKYMWFLVNLLLMLFSFFRPRQMNGNREFAAKHRLALVLVAVGRMKALNLVLLLFFFWKFDVALFV